MLKGGPNWTASHPMWGLSDAEIFSRWESHGADCRARGTLFHSCIERSLNGEAPTDDWPPEYFSGYEKFASALPSTLRPYRSEWRIFSKSSRIAGTIDAAFMADDGTLELYDWKRTASIPRTNDYRTGLNAMSVHPDCKGVRYFLQLNLYRAILERDWGFSVSRMCVVGFHPGNADMDKAGCILKFSDGLFSSPAEGGIQQMLLQYLSRL